MMELHFQKFRETEPEKAKQLLLPQRRIIWKTG
jgi:hypothetical protein